MTDKQLLLALGELDDDVIAAAHEPLRKKLHRPLRVALIAAAIAVVSLTVAWGAVAGYRAIFLKTEAEYWNSAERKNDLQPTYFNVDEFSNVIEQPGWRAEPHAEGMAGNGQFCADQVGQQYTYSVRDKLAREEDGEIVVVEPSNSNWYVTVNDGGGMPSLSAMEQYEPYFHPDVSYLESTLTSVDGSFCFYSETGSCYTFEAKTLPDQLYRLFTIGGYRTASKGTFDITFDYMPAEGIGPTIYVGNSIARQEVIKSADGTEFDVFQVRDVIIAETVFPYGHVLIHGLQCTWDEVADQIAHLDLNDVPAVFSTGN